MIATLSFTRTETKNDLWLLSNLPKDLRLGLIPSLMMFDKLMQRENPSLNPSPSQWRGTCYLLDASGMGLLNHVTPYLKVSLHQKRYRQKSLIRVTLNIDIFDIKSEY